MAVREGEGKGRVEEGEKRRERKGGREGRKGGGSSVYAPGGRPTGCLFPRAVESPPPPASPSQSPLSPRDPGLGKMQLVEFAGPGLEQERSECTGLILMFTFLLSMPSCFL